jgi:hypothetical protein
MSVSISFKSKQFYFFKFGLSLKCFLTSAVTIAVIFCAAFLVFPAPAEADAGAVPVPVAAVGSMSGDFEYMKAGADKYSVVKRAEAAAMNLYDRDALKTPESVSGVIETGYGAKIELKEKTEIEFGVLSVRIKRGDMWINYKRRGDGASGDNFKVITPAGTIGIKGTAFRTVVLDESGAVTFTNEAGDVKIVEAGFSLTIDAGGKSAAPVKIEELEKKDGAAPDGEPNGGVGGGDNRENSKNSEKNQNNKNGDNGKTGGKSSGEAPAGVKSEPEKPLQIEENSSVNTELNPFE